MSAPTTMQWLRTAASRISVGSGRLATHQARRAVDFGRRRYEAIAGWVGKSSGLAWLAKVALLLVLASRIRILIVAIAERVYERVESGAWGGLLFTAAGLWIVGAYRAGRDGWKPKKRPAPEPEQPDAEPDEANEEQSDGAVEQMPAGPPLPILPDLRISLAKVGTPHAHIAVLAADIGTTPERVREALTKWAIPVEDVRMQGRGVSTGVKGGSAVHPALAPRPDDVAVVAAGQPTNNNDNNTDEAESGERFRVVPIGNEGHIVYDAQDTVRHHKVSGQ